MKRRSLILIANEEISIIKACQYIGMEISDDAIYGRSIKVHCPFGEIHHIDSGVDPAFRIYHETNSAYCFAGCGYFTPVRLIAHARGVSQRTAAADLLERVGYHFASSAQIWAELTETAIEPDRNLLADALKIFCERVAPGWEALQFEQPISGVLCACLSLLDRVTTDSEAEQWLSGCKQIMMRALTASSPLLASS